MKKIFIKLWLPLVCLINLFFLSNDILAQEDYRDPFADQFPEEPVTVSEEVVEQPPVSSVPLPSLVVTGILYAKKGISTAIVNGKVYKVGDIVEGTVVKIHKIEKDRVFVLFQGGLFELKIEVKDIGKKEKI